MSTTPTPLPIQSFQLKKSDLDQEGLPTLNAMFIQLQTQISALNGAAGKTVMASGIDVKGATVTGVGEPQTSTDAVSKIHAEQNYSAAAIAPQLESGGGRSSLKTFRALNSKAQQETNSTFLNRMSNTSPSTNTTVVTAGAPSGGSVTITVPAGFHLRVDGSIAPFGTFSDTVALPSSQAITGLTRTTGVVTATGTFSGLSAGEPIYELGALDASFDGTFILITASGSTLTWAQPGFADATTTGGAVSTGGAFYFYLKYPSQTLAVSGPFPVDNQQNRLVANADGQVLIAVAVINSAGLVTTQSAAGATVPAAVNNGNRIVSRL